MASGPTSETAVERVECVSLFMTRENLEKAKERGISVRWELVDGFSRACRLLRHAGIPYELRNEAGSGTIERSRTKPQFVSRMFRNEINNEILIKAQRTGRHFDRSAGTDFMDSYQGVRVSMVGPSSETTNDITEGEAECLILVLCQLLRDPTRPASLDPVAEVAPGVGAGESSEVGGRAPEHRSSVSKRFSKKPRPFLRPMLRGTTLTSPRGSGYVCSVCMVSAGVLASGYMDGTIMLWDTHTGLPLHTFVTPSQVLHLCMASENTLVSWSGHRLRLWDTTTGICAAAWPTGWVLESMCMVSEYHVACGYVGRIALVDLKTGSVTRMLEWGTGEDHARTYHCLCLVCPGVLASAFRSMVRLWDLRTGNLMRELNGHSDRVESLCMVSEGVLASGSEDDKVILWDLRTGDVIRTLTGHSGCVTSLCMVSEGVLASASRDRTVRLWDLRTGAPTHNLTGRPGDPHSLCMVEDGVLASGAGDRTVRLWDLRPGANIPSTMPRRFGSILRHVAPPDAAPSGSVSGVVARQRRGSGSPPLPRGSSFTSHVLLPPGFDRRTTYDESAWGVVTACVAHTMRRSGGYASSGTLGLPRRPLDLIGSFLSRR